jgi:hypothetical protein
MDQIHHPAGSGYQMEFLWREREPCGEGQCEGADQRRSTFITTRRFDRPRLINALYHQESMGTHSANPWTAHTQTLGSVAPGKAGEGGATMGVVNSLGH